MKGRSRSTLFLMEQLIVIAVFAICASVCVKILSVSFLMVVESVDTRNALLVAESAAEGYKAFSGDMLRTAEALGVPGSYAGGSMTVFYDENWHPVPEAEGVFMLRFWRNGPVLSELEVVNLTTGDVLINFSVAARRLN